MSPREAGSKIISTGRCFLPLYPENQPDWLEKQTSISLVSEKGSSFGLLVGPGESWKRLEVFVEAQVEAGQLLKRVGQFFF